jgi:DNA-binding MarR family transcriptional regulator
MDLRVTKAAEAVESVVDSLVSVLDTARLAQTPAIPPAQLRVLTIIEVSRHTTIGRLADALEVVPSSASRLCDRLEATGLVRRVPDPRDRREVRLLLTPAARRLLDQLRDRRRGALAEVLDRMPEQYRQDLVRALRAFADAAGADHGGMALRTA